MSVLFSLNQVSKAYGDDTLFTDLTLDFKAKEQLGLIGMNGSGKSTLLKLIKGMVTPDTGELVVHQKNRFVYLAQEDVGQGGSGEFQGTFCNTRHINNRNHAPHDHGELQQPGFVQLSRF